MRSSTLCIIVVLLAVATAPSISAQTGETRYVTDKLTINVRSGPSLENKILAMPACNERVEVLETQGEWSRVRLQNGTEGWTQERYLVKETPRALLADRYESELAKAKEELSKTKAQLTEVSARAEDLDKSLKSTSENLSQTEGDFQKLKSESVEYLSLKKSFEELREKHQKQNEELKALEVDYEKALFSQKIKWFLAGSAVFVVGWIIGYTVRRKSQKRSFGLK